MSFSEFDWVEPVPVKVGDKVVGSATVEGDSVHMDITSDEVIRKIQLRAIKYAQDEGLIPRDYEPVSRGIFQQLPAWVDTTEEMIYARKAGLPGWEFPLSEDEE